MKSLVTCLVAGAQYLLHPQKLGSIQEMINPDSIVPVTLLSTSEIFGDVDGLLRLYDIYDDVFTPEFGSILVEKPEGNSSDLNIVQNAGNMQIQQLYHLGEVATMAGMGELPSGPYFLHGPNLHQAWKLYDDDHEAFTFGVIPEDVNGAEEFRAVNALSSTGTYKSIPVPSRLYRPPPNTRKPLSGLRIAITDTLSLSGVQTTQSSRAWSSLGASVATSTADFVQRLLDLGAIIVGKTKTSQFDAGLDWVDAVQPWNPRADEYQTSRSGSAGAAVALAAYDWVHHSVGHEGIEGIGSSAGSTGVFSMRISDRAVSSAEHDAPGSYHGLSITDRYIVTLYDAVSAIHGLADHPSTLLPTRIIYLLDLLATGPNEQQALNNAFVSSLENYLGIKAEPLSMANTWTEQPPLEANGADMQEYIGDASFRLLCYESYHHFGQFRQEYGNEFHRQPFVEPTVRYRWEIGKLLSHGDADELRGRLDIFRKWFNQTIMPIDSYATSATIMVLPWHMGEPKYRDEKTEPPNAVHGFTAELLATVLGTPYLLVPFAQLPYESRISDNTEYRPFSGSIIGPRGGDLMMLRLVQRAFELADWRSTVDTGRLSFPLGNNSRNVDDQRVRITKPPALSSSRDQLLLSKPQGKIDVAP
ncbi:hypothetical protein S40293_09794 [Stachybotrys chartarum IBT 40293]|nr:hypothetical protein S40293_09794 [Stachybotrys chartarum IBT 40293]KFA79875.1 hypothetical protein S40288_03734 [Stachybotrys chartarum IBT 40288]